MCPTQGKAEYHEEDVGTSQQAAAAAERRQMAMGAPLACMQSEAGGCCLRGCRLPSPLPPAACPSLAQALWSCCAQGGQTTLMTALRLPQQALRDSPQAASFQAASSGPPHDPQAPRRCQCQGFSACGPPPTPRTAALQVVPCCPQATGSPRPSPGELPLARNGSSRQAQQQLSRASSTWPPRASALRPPPSAIIRSHSHSYTFACGMPGRALPPSQVHGMHCKRSSGSRICFIPGAEPRWCMFTGAFFCLLLA